MDTLLQDLRYALRSLAKAPAFTAIAVICLALGIAANVTVFTPINTLLLRPLPFREPERLLGVHMSPLSRGQEEQGWSYPDYRDLGNGSGAFEATGLVAQRSWNLGGVAEPERVAGARITASLFPMLGLAPAVGRQLRPEEDEGGRVMLISHALWMRRFGGDRNIVGTAITMNGEPYTVVGIMPEGIRFPEIADVWLPIDPAEAKDHRDWRYFQLIGRLAPGVSEDMARTRLAEVTRRLAEQYPETNGGWGAWAQPYRDLYAKESRSMMLILLGAVGFVLLIACANVANLLLARASGRQKEIAVRLALGASRWRVVRQLLVESLVLAIAGGVLGTFLGTWGIDVVTRTLPVDLPFWMVFDVDYRVLLMTFGVTLLTGVIFGLAPALQASSPALSETLKDSGGRSNTATLRTGRLRSTLVITEIALSLVLLVGAALMVRSFLQTQTANLGFDPQRVLTFETSLQGTRYASDTAREAFHAAMRERIARIPGVQQVGAVAQLPVESCCDQSGYIPEGKEYPRAEAPLTLTALASPGYFETMRIALLEGRLFDERDRIGTPRVVLVNRKFAEREWPGEHAVGKRLRLMSSLTDEPYTVVGVVQDIVQNRVITKGARPQVFLAYGQNPWRTMTTVVRTAGDPSAITSAVRGAVAELDGNLPLARLRTMPQVLHQRLFEPRVYGLMFAIFAIAALTLASIGLYGVMSYTVAMRTHELGVRVALGAQPADVLRLVLRSGARLVGLGLAIGLPAALILAQLLRGTLYGVSPNDALTFLTIPLLLTTVAVIASYVPARRATKVDPMVALRRE